VIEGPYLLSTDISIDASGIKGNTRHDGVVYFGQSSSNEYIYNDFNFPQNELGVGKRHLLIKFIESPPQYILRDLSDGTGTFIKIVKPLKLSNGVIISFCDNHMSYAYDEVTQQVTLKFLEGVYANERKVFPTAFPIVIGRDASCTMVFQSASLSRKQCTIYKGSEGIYIADGDGKKTSTNGTWIFVDSDCVITDGLIFKAGQSLFKAKLISSQP
jgi:hypothetical protein